MNDDRAVWRKGDLCTVDGHGDDVFEVIDAGMGMPRAGMELLRLDGKCHVTNVCSAGLRRPQPVRGMWVRRLGNHRRARVIFNSGTVPNPSLTCDYEETSSNTFEPVFFSAHPKYWVPVATPKDFRGCDCEPGSKQDFEYQKFLVGELTEKLRDANEKVSLTRDELATVRASLAASESREEMWRKEVYSLRDVMSEQQAALNETIRQRSCLEVELKNTTRNLNTEIVKCHQLQEALQGTSKSSDEIERLKTEVFLWKEKSRLRARENQHLFALYEARIQRDKQKKRILM